MTVHHLKSWPSFFSAILAGEKTHDLRREDDRTFQIGDRLVLEEYDPFGGGYTGRKCKARVTYITSNRTPCAFSSSVLPKEYVILSLKLEETSK